MDAEFLRACRSYAELPPAELPELAIVGRSNCGKSSLVNALCRRKGLARTSSTPGRTQQIVLFRASLITRTLQLADLPGYGFAKVPRQLQRSWAEMVEQYIDQRPNLCMLLLLNDLRRPPEQQERDLLRWGRNRGLQLQVALTKADKLAKAQRFGALQGARKALDLDDQPLLVSVREPATVDRLRDRLEHLLPESP